ncbi:thialysine N-epsilon-acetyltransferase-like [Hydractinia symbiolongicarpus]|uniref:thialysine N-epsilon-acetyltransferase-like n=1 Tax=Hydractinia symbiolongicarpus TaxID=13093 RepID=UPI00254ACE33|nr:thialysine N-epsilon-acetyltransferase-like [Hydractinia symbiolongicarpus]
MDTLGVREATSDDCEEIFRMVIELTQYESQPLNLIKTTAESLKEDGFKNKPWYNCLVATKNAEIIGYLLYFRTYSMQHGRSMQMKDLYVRLGHRHVRVGKRLIKELSIIALREKCKLIHWRVLNDNGNAIGFYKNIGGDMQSNVKIGANNGELKNFATVRL